jgi:hypothetical protein
LTTDRSTPAFQEFTDQRGEGAKTVMGTFGNPEAHVFTLKKVKFGNESHRLPCVPILSPPYPFALWRVHTVLCTLDSSHMRGGGECPQWIVQARDTHGLTPRDGRCCVQGAAERVHGLVR